ncbi:hypothetical protein [Methylophaga thiooxydans]|uniref:hypothetical protein n=1 Tax=Methylophaga thiooxydans TaxID=392484 RepID=UPI0005C4E07C|nr:hypothetical protein [Methylophaga thiooxydans]
MPTKFQWKDTELQVETRFSPKRLFWGTETTLKNGEKEILRASGSGFSMNDEKTYEINPGQKHHLHLNVYPRALSMRYCLRVDGIEVSAGELIPENLLIGFAAIGAQVLLASYLFSSAL